MGIIEKKITKKLSVEEKGKERIEREEKKKKQEKKILAEKKHGSITTDDDSSVRTAKSIMMDDDQSISNAEALNALRYELMKMQKELLRRRVLDPRHYGVHSVDVTVVQQRQEARDAERLAATVLSQQVHCRTNSLVHSITIEQDKSLTEVYALALCLTCALTH